jgi:hypothetical protein
MLELVGLLLPFIVVPNMLINQHVILRVDNMACIYGWDNKYVKEDKMASILIRCIYFISCRLGSVIHVQHLPRLSTWEAEVVDRMSRYETTTTWDSKLLRSFSFPKMPEAFRKWLREPEEDWSLPLRLVDEIDTIVNA